MGRGPGDTTVAAAMLDRLLHRSVVLNLDGDSYRLATTTPRAKHSVTPRPAPADRCDTRPSGELR